LPLASLQGQDFTAYQIFQRPLPGATGDNQQRMTFLPATSLRTDVLFLPGAAKQIEVIAESLRQSVSGMITQTEWEQRGGYQVLCARGTGGAYPMPNERGDWMSNWTELPLGMEARLAQHAADAFPPGLDSDAERIRSLVTYLGERCEYQLGVRMHRPVYSERPEIHFDPVLQFIDEHRKGHCELFASAAVLLLRSQGIPARYVTGLVCGERVAGHWVARLEHAHAWTEAYDRDEGAWVLVEATPPGGRPDVQATTGLFARLGERLSAMWQLFMARVRRGEFAAVLAEAVAAAFRFLWTAVRSPAGWLATLAVLALACRKYWKRRQLLLAEGPELRHLWSLREKVEKRLRRFSLERNETQTIGDLRRQLDNSDYPWAGEALSFLQLYEALRYDPDKRNASGMRELHNRWESLRKGTKKNGQVVARA
jgi:hypothetical protein